MEVTEKSLFRQFVCEEAQKYSRLPVNSAKKKEAMAAGLAIYAPGVKAIAVTVEDGKIVYVSAEHPRAGFIEVSVPALLPAA